MFGYIYTFILFVLEGNFNGNMLIIESHMSNIRIFNFNTNTLSYIHVQGNTLHLFRLK